MQDSRWLRNAWEILHQNQCGVSSASLQCLQVSNAEGDAIGKSAWFKQFSKGIVWWRMLGSGAACSDYVTLPCRRGEEIEVANATAKWFAIQPRKLMEAPQAIEVEGHRADCPQWQSFFDALVDRGWTRDSVNIESAWRVELPENWKAYDSTLSKSRRRKARRAVKMFEQGGLSFRLIETPAEIDQTWPEFVRLHQMRRIQLGQPGCFSNSDFEKFLKSVTIEFAQDNSAFFAQMDFEGTPLAILLVFRAASSWFIYQSGFDTNRIDLEPGHLVNGLTLKRAIDTGVKFLDYLRGDEHYKSGWKAAPSALSRSVLLPPGIASRGIASALKIKRNLQAWLKPNKAESNNVSDESTEE